VFACLELAAIALHLADRVAPLEDTSIILHGSNWPGYLMSQARWQPGLRLYRPWQGPGININALGLRTPPPTPRVSGEWRIAITGGSAVWGWRVLDADTIPVQLQQLEHVSKPNLTFFNFGIEGATLAQELALLHQFRDTYGINQVIFYTGANDALNAYLEMAGARKQMFDAVDGLASFELVKAATRFAQTVFESSGTVLANSERKMLSRLKQINELRAGLIAADDYCNATQLRCDFLLQPLLFTRTSPVGPELRLVHTFGRLFPGFATVAAQMYHDALVSMPASRIHDLSDMFEGIAEPVFTDNVHVNEAGNRIAAERIRSTISFRPL
jgi:lysophospholipase L1-like esterase